MKEEVGMIVIGNEDVHESVTIVVGDGHAHSFARVLGDSSLGRDICERAIAIVAIESVREICIIVGVTIGPELGSWATVRIFVDFPLAVVRDEQVEQAIIVIVHPGQHRPHLLAVEEASYNPSFVGDVGECAVPVVVQQLILSNVQDINVRKPVIVIISNRDTHAVADACHILRQMLKQSTTPTNGPRA
jgi:hypothetical protein